MKRCQKCGNLIEEYHQFCGRCGADLHNPKICPKCYYESFDDDFCVYCGMKLLSKKEYNHFNNLTKKTWELYRNRRYIEAIKVCDKILKIFPHIQTLNRKADCLTSLARYDDALDYYDEALEENPNNSSSFFGKGDCFVKMGRYDDAIDCYAKSLELDYEKTAAHAKFFALLKLGKHDELINDLSDIYLPKIFNFEEIIDYYLKIGEFDKALNCAENLKNDNYGAYLNQKSEIYLRMGKYDKIMSYCNNLLENDSNNFFALDCKIKCLIKLFKYGEAIKCYDELLKKDSYHFYALNGKISVLFKLKKYDLLKDIFSKIDSEKPYFTRDLLNYYLETNQPKEALFYLEKYSESSKYFNIEIVNNYLKLGEYGKVIKFCNDALKKYPASYTVWLLKGHYYCSLSKFDEALECYEKALNINKSQNKALFYKINLYLKMGKYSEAYKILIDINPIDFQEWDKLTKYYMQINKFDDALNCVEKTLSLNYNIEYLVRKAEIYFELKRFDESKKICKDAYQLNSKYAPLVDLITKIKEVDNNLLE